MYTIMAIKLSPRTKIAPTVQEILTKYGCIIKVRLGLHEASTDDCSTTGLILLELLSAEKEQIVKLSEELDSLEYVTAKLLEL
ncbi:hypothetical protein [Clostridium folliculivorans]|uniref:Iron-only hydrogenase system regulator n=1 Tax=Clostridium folliculivorans TaxID=2886038 RepID=A0A9W6DBF1_9CLOT|nr:hypothetical protein [Clostridium folliculivorans]GKU25653.1 hypothetical protein CFOLD11_24790 [Clostridium folliculivorans]GKU28675.1 hypothetical protein CFB3_07810 [Clostridium folliculivorans]